MQPPGCTYNPFVFAELCLYLELLVFLAGTFLYGFLASELRRRPRVLPGNRALRALLLALTVWFGGTLIDELLYMLVGPQHLPVPLAVVLDLGRAGAWLLSLPLLVHTLAHARVAAGGARWLRWLPLPSYLGLGLFVGPAIDFVRAADIYLSPAARAIYPRIAGHASLALFLAAGLTLSLTAAQRAPRLVAFLRLLVAALGLMLALLLAGLVSDPWQTAAEGGERLLRSALLALLLLPGVVFALYVQRYNLLRLSFSYRTLRHFLTVLLLVTLVMLGGPAVAADQLPVFRRFVAWGLLLALCVGAAYRPLMDRALRRSTSLRRLLGKDVSAEELDRLMASIQQLELDEDQALARTADELEVWLGAPAAFLPEPREDAGLDLLWTYFAAPEHQVVHRLAPPGPRFEALLERRQLYAVFPLRVEGRLQGLLGLAGSLAGGFTGEEVEAVQLVLRQLAATLTLRRMVEARIAEERRLAEHEHLGMLGLVTASLAHELKNPLSSMKVLAQALREELAAADPDAEGVTDLDLIVEQIDRLDRTAGEILGVVRPRHGEVTELTALVQSALYVLGAEARKRGVTLDGTAVEAVGTVEGSAAAWQTVVFNLVLNAVEHTPAGATAAVTLQRREHTLVFTTENPGPPLDEAAARRLFDPFVSEGGTGLGLALVARRVKELGGVVGAESTGGVVRFRVEVEVAKAGEEVGTPASSAEEAMTEEVG